MRDIKCAVLLDARKVRDYGIGEYIQGILRELKGQPICLLGYRRDRDLFEFPMLEVKSRGYTLYEQYEIWSKINEIRAGLFHTPHYVFPMLYRGKLVVTIHDIIHLIYPQYFRFGAFYYARLLIKEALRRADAIITVSKRSRSDLLKIYPHAANKIHVVYNGISEEYFSDVDHAAEEFVLRFKPYILTVGNNKPHKRFDLLKKVFTNLPRKDLNLVIAGFEGENKDRVFHLGFVERPILRALYKNAAVLVHPAEYEGFGFPPFEASAVGTPVLTTRVGAVDEILGDSVTYFRKNDDRDLQEKLMEILDDPDTFRLKAASAFQKVQKLRWKITAQKTLRIYRSIFDF